ncbi:triokinase/FMN cyclase [Lampetra fluviatilis]
MLSAAVSGHVFASPAPSAVLAAVRALAQSGAMGVLLVVKNYAGDRLNFGVAAERARAEGVEVETVVVADDCATPATRRLHRRGLCGTLLVHKVAGALAEQGRPLSEVAREAWAAARATVTLAVGLSSCQVPGLALPRWSTPLQAGEMDLGVGIHGEAGAERVALAPARDVVRIMLERMVGDGGGGRLPLHRGERVALMVNNLGGTSHLELGVIAREAARQLGLRGVMVERSYVGTFMTALAMAGVSLTVMRLDHKGIRLHCLDVDTNAPSWPRVSWTSSLLLSLSSAGRAYGDTCGGGHGGGQYVAEEEELEQGDALDEGRGQEKDHEKGHQQQEGHRQQKDCQQKEHQQKETVWDYHQEVGHEQGKSRRWAIEKMDEEADQGDSADRPEPPRLGHEARGLHGGQRGGEDDSDPGAPVRAAMTEVCEALLALESELNDLDSGSGDGDCGTSHARGARASLHWLRHLRANPRTASATIPGHLLRGLSELLEEDMGGTSGALYSLMLSAAAGALGSAPRPFPADWARAFAAAVRAVRRHGGARPGDRTMLDPLWAAHLELRKEEAHMLNAKEVLARAVDRATAQALATAQMGARAGRARWARVGEAWGRVDPGARAVEVALKARLPPLKEFVGREGDWGGFQRRFLAHKEMVKWTDDEALRALPAMLDSDALATLTSVPRAKRATLQMALQLLAAVYGPPLDCRQLFYDRQRGAKESPLAGRHLHCGSPDGVEVRSTASSGQTEPPGSAQVISNTHALLQL